MAAPNPWLMALIHAGAPTLAVVVTYAISRRKLNDIHGLVNSRLEKALGEISELKRTIEDLRK